MSLTFLLAAFRAFSPCYALSKAKKALRKNTDEYHHNGLMAEPAPTKVTLATLAKYRPISRIEIQSWQYFFGFDFELLHHDNVDTARV